MEETNEISQNVKQAIYDYYMKYIKEKFSFLYDREKMEERITASIIQLIDAKLKLKNATITKDEITQILREVMNKDLGDPMLSSMREENINSTFPDIATVTIEEEQTVNLEEVKTHSFGENETTTGYLYVSDGFYNANIQKIEATIKQLEKAFSHKDIEGFDEQFTKDMTIKRYELDSAKEYENARLQINEKQKKFDAIKEKVISDYGRKYQEIIARDISEQEKQTLLKQLLEETKSYDDKTNAARIQLQEENQKLFHNFQNRAKDSETIMKEMTAMHLFDRDKYMEDKKGEQNPQLAELYAKRDGLNTYRKEHNQPIYEVKQSTISSLLNSIARNLRGEKPQLMLEYHPERDIPTEINPIITPHQEGIDENLLKALAHLYGEQVKKKEKPTIDTTEFEAHLVKYFRAHYKDIMEEGYNHFLSKFAEMPDEIEKNKKEGELAKIAKQYGIDPKNFNCFGYKFSIREGLIYEENCNKLATVHYFTDKGINSVIEDLYGKALYKEHSGMDSKLISDIRELKNGFIEYAKQHNINIENAYTLEKMEVNQDKVANVSRYINELVNKELAYSQEKYEPTDYTETIAQDIAENYSTIMNLDFYSFGNLASVKSILGDKYLSDGLLRISQDSILNLNEFSPRLVYATPEYCAREYANIMDKIHTLNATTNPFLDGYFDFTKENAMKDALRTYIQEHGIDVDISIEQVPINQEKINMIANAMVEKYKDEAKKPKTFKNSITKKLQENWSEIMTEMQVVQVGEMFKDELKENSFVNEQLYVRDDFIYLGDYENYCAQCIYATPQYLETSIAKLDETISTRDSLIADREKRVRNILAQYAQDNNIELNIPSLASISLQQEERKRDENRMFGRMFNDMLPDDPTAREKINLNDTIMDIFVKMSEGNPGALTAIMALAKENPDSILLLLGLDDMNIRGSQIWQVYKYYCNEDVKKFKEAIQNREADMVLYLNTQNTREGEEKAVSGGASFNRNKRPDLYRFTAEDVKMYQELREEIQKSKKTQKEQTKEDTRERKGKKRYIRRKNKTIEKSQRKQKDVSDVSDSLEER